jgi:hypothetical protein
MTRPDALPLIQQIVLDLLAPPAITFIWWLLSRGKAYQLGENSNPAVQGWLSDGWKYLLAILYLVAISITIYGYFY